MSRIKIIRKGKGDAFLDKRGKFVFVNEGVHFALDKSQMRQMSELFVTGSWVLKMVLYLTLTPPQLIWQRATDSKCFFQHLKANKRMKLNAFAGTSARWLSSFFASAANKYLPVI